MTEFFNTIAEKKLIRVFNNYLKSTQKKMKLIILSFFFNNFLITPDIFLVGEIQTLNHFTFSLLYS